MEEEEEEQEIGEAGDDSAVEQKDSSISENNNDVESGKFELSNTVEKARDKSSDGTPINAVILAQNILENRSEYADGRVTVLDLKETAQEQTVQAWIDKGIRGRP